MHDIKTETEGLVAHGVSACAGCGMELVLRTILNELGPDTILVIPPGCSALFCGFGKETGVKVAGFQGNLENSAAYASGIRAGLTAQGNLHTTVFVFAGDGGTVDIGLQSLSGMLERGDRVLYVCYDNEAYMNTGIQGSSSTPCGARTTTTPGGKPTRSKDLLSIVIAHRAPYAASASVADIPDLLRKVRKAREADGPAVLHVHAPCPTGWGCAPAKSIEVARLAVQTGAWVLYECDHGVYNLTKKVKKLKPLTEYFDAQRRFCDQSPENVAEQQKYVVENYEKLVRLSAANDE